MMSRMGRSQWTAVNYARWPHQGRAGRTWGLSVQASEWQVSRPAEVVERVCLLLHTLYSSSCVSSCTRPSLVRCWTTSPTCSHSSPTFHHTLQCMPPATATSSNQEPSGELVTVHSLSPHLLHGIAYRQNWNSCGRWQQHSGAIWSLYFVAPHTDYIIHLRPDCRRRTTNYAVTVAVAHCTISIPVTIVPWRRLFNMAAIIVNSCRR